MKERENIESVIAEFLSRLMEGGMVQSYRIERILPSRAGAGQGERLVVTVEFK